MTVVVTAGHVDHGKSTLVAALTGVHPDRLAIEQLRGMTVELGFGVCQLPSGAEVSFVDVPGHVRYLRTMIAGAGTVTGALLVVSALEGWREQSEEHLGILERLGVRAAVAAITRADQADAARIDEVATAVGRRLDRSGIELVATVPTAAPAGVGLAELGNALDRLVALLPAPVDRGAPRLWIDRSFALPGTGAVVTGTLAHGTLRVGDEVTLEPSGRPTRIRGLHRHGRSVEELGPGTRAAVNLRLPAAAARRGDVLVRPEQWHRTHRVDATLHLLPDLGHDVGRRGAYAVHLGTAEVTARLRVLGAESLGPGDEGLVRLHLSCRLPLVPGDRYVLRDLGRGQTVGGGEVLDVDPQRPATQAHPEATVARVVADRGAVTVDELMRLSGHLVPPTVGNWAIDPRHHEHLVTELRDRLTAAGDDGVALAELTEPTRSLAADLAERADLELRHGRLRPAGDDGPGQDHALLRRLGADPFRPPRPDPGDRAALRDLVAAGEVVACDGTWFTREAVDAAAAAVADLLDDHPDGVSVGMVRDRLGSTRRHVVPLLVHLDRTGRTRRRGDLRIAGPRLRTSDRRAR